MDSKFSALHPVTANAHVLLQFPRDLANEIFHEPRIAIRLLGDVLLIGALHVCPDDGSSSFSGWMGPDSMSKFHRAFPHGREPPGFRRPRSRPIEPVSQPEAGDPARGQAAGVRLSLAAGTQRCGGSSNRSRWPLSRLNFQDPRRLRRARWRFAVERKPLLAPRYYIAGPPQMVASMLALLVDAGVPRERIRTDEFFGY